ncbi:anticodon nuclease, partial [Pseudomonas aeruginosa]
MGKTLGEVAKQLGETEKKVLLIYAFNGSGKTRLSREFKQLVAPKNGDTEGLAADQSESPRNKILYYSAFTEDLFYWDNDLTQDVEYKLRIQPNSFTDWLLTLLRDLGQDGNIVRYFQHYANDKLTPHFSEDFSEVTFSLERGDDESSG